MHLYSTQDGLRSLQTNGTIAYCKNAVSTLSAHPHTPLSKAAQKTRVPRRLVLQTLANEKARGGIRWRNL